MEQEALDEMCKVLGGGMRAEEIQELWQEYETNSSLEANLVKDFDKVEMILQALEYEKSMGRSWMSSFCQLPKNFKQKSGKDGSRNNF
ncbi:5'-deoxynucleotidase HDDC2-like isoform X3 [Salvia hispanica]|uniref:5'-deoxynucleotidase HDDC2-like isoform X3 n=1 Tax=Salvia hispanica TaxID=49212 RepID=UPI0020098D91|nr:5'-deoxynucleotidase HDDC2-like isoform X3 [Salvia hispanica]